MIKDIDELYKGDQVVIVRRHFKELGKLNTSKLVGVVCIVNRTFRRSKNNKVVQLRVPDRLGTSEKIITQKLKNLRKAYSREKLNVPCTRCGNGTVARGKKYGNRHECLSCGKTYNNTKGYEMILEVFNK